jgi:hypothetical protein
MYEHLFRLQKLQSVSLLVYTRNAARDIFDDEDNLLVEHLGVPHGVAEAWCMLKSPSP